MCCCKYPSPEHDQRPSHCEEATLRIRRAQRCLRWLHLRLCLEFWASWEVTDPGVNQHRCGDYTMVYRENVGFIPWVYTIMFPTLPWGLQGKLTGKLIYKWYHMFFFCIYTDFREGNGNVRFVFFTQRNRDLTGWTNRNMWCQLHMWIRSKQLWDLTKKHRIGDKGYDGTKFVGIKYDVISWKVQLFVVNPTLNITKPSPILRRKTLFFDHTQEAVYVCKSVYNFI